jgi:hypothetical protein
VFFGGPGLNLRCFQSLPSSSPASAGTIASKAGGKMFWRRMPVTKVVAALFAVALLGSCESLHGAFAKLSGQMSITSDALPMASNQESYRTVLVAAGGTTPYKWVLLDGWLPSGMKLQADGVLTGTPEVPGEFFFTVQASDGSQPVRSASKLLKLRVSSQGPAIITSKSELPWGRVGSEYQVKFTVWGGVKPYAWRTQDALPPGLKLHNDGTLFGKPAQGGDFSFIVQVSDLMQSTARKFSLHISPAQVDAFGGVTALHSPRGGTGRWRTEKIGKRWVLITPAGNAFWMIGIWGVAGDSLADERGGTYDKRSAAKYGNAAIGSLQANRRLTSWGFNALGPWTYRMLLPMAQEPEWGGPQPVKIAFVWKAANPVVNGRGEGAFKVLTQGMDPKVKALEGQVGANFPDVFDPSWVANTGRLYASDKDLKEKAKSPYFIGAFSDEADWASGFGPGTDFLTQPPDKMHAHLGYLALVTAPAQVTNPYSTPPGQRYADTKVYTKYALRDFLRAKYRTIEALNAAWGSKYSTFDSDGGWPNGNGLLDENGRTTHTWLGNGDPHLRAGSGISSNVVKDLDDFLYLLAREYLSVERDAFRKITPNGLFLGPTTIGGWKAPARAPIYRAAGEILDVVTVSTDASQEQLDFITRAAGDVPLMIWQGIVANPDSSRWRYTDSDVAAAAWYVKTQAARAQLYGHELDSLFSGRSSVTGSNHYVGMLWWWWLDMISEQKNWGLVSLMDNAYDGVEGGVAKGIDAWGYPTGGEEKNYGDFIGPAREMNYSIFERLASEAAAQAQAGAARTGAR